MADKNASSSTASAEKRSSSNRNQNRNRNQGQKGRGRGGRGQNKGRGGFGFKDQGGGRRKKDMGRGEWNRQDVDKRKRNQDEQDAKRRKIEEGGEGAVAASPFSKEEIEAESRKPKRKVAVMIGYAGSGYKGMQINNQEKTIEGDLFKAFVAAGAISKANADDPKKSSLVRCARTDKGVHAAGNVISLKLIVEEPNIIQMINENLPPQIRVWGIERTNGAFSCYQTCDSRWYEYLIPTYSFIPPHPESFLGKKLVESAEQEGIYETYQSLQADAATFWTDAEQRYVKPILDALDPELRKSVVATIHSSEEETEGSKKASKKEAKDTAKQEAAESIISEGSKAEIILNDEVKTAVPGDPIKAQEVQGEQKDSEQKKRKISEDEDDLVEERPTSYKQQRSAAASQPESEVTEIPHTELKAEEASEKAAASKSILTPLEQAVKDVKAAYIVAKKAYRISIFRRERVQEALTCYLGTCNFHNYTIQKAYSDPSAKRVIRSFEVGPHPIIINDTEWLSLKVHGQSFMMHQIRKMVAMAALLIRCGAKTDIIKESYGPANISIPKAPGLGLLLERPVFDNYNERAVKEFNRETIDFNKYQKEMDEFKQKEIYDRIFREEERDHQFHAFFHHIDHYKTDYFLWVTAGGIAAAKQSKAPARTDDASDDEADVNGEEG